MVKLAEVAEVKVVGDVEVNVNVYVPAVVCVKFVNVAKPLTAVTVVVPPKVPPDAETVTDAFECETVLPTASTMRTTGCVANNAPEVLPTGCVVTAIAEDALKARTGRNPYLFNFPKLCIDPKLK